MVSEQFVALSESATEVAGQRGFNLRSPFSERHGSWEMVFHKENDGLHRFLLIGLSEPSNEHEGRWLIELYVVAEDDKYSHRELNASFSVELSDLDAWVKRPAFTAALLDALDAAADMAPTEWKRNLIFSPVSIGAGASGRPVIINVE